MRRAVPAKRVGSVSRDELKKISQCPATAAEGITAKSGPQIDQSDCRIRPCHIIKMIIIWQASLPVKWRTVIG